MRVGIYLDLRNPPPWRRPWSYHYARTLEIVEEAERLGAASVWLAEHHFYEDGFLPQPLTLAAALAARTKSMRIGTGTLLIPHRNILEVAEHAAIVDVLSDGRLDLGVGIGYRPRDIEPFGGDFRHRFSNARHQITELQRIWGEGDVTPPCIQQPVPIWGGFLGPRGAYMTGELGLSLLSLNPELYEPYRAGLVAGGHDPAQGRMAGPYYLVLADDPESAWPRIAPHYAYQWNSYRRYAVEGTDSPVPPPIDVDRWRRPGPTGQAPRIQVLTPAAAAEFILGRAEGVPAEEVFLWISIAGMADDLVEQNIQLICTDLAKRLAPSCPESLRVAGLSP